MLIERTLQGNSENDAEVIKGRVQYLGSVDLIQYYIASYKIIDKTQMNTEQVWTIQVRSPWLRTNYL